MFDVTFILSYSKFCNGTDLKGTSTASASMAIARREYTRLII